MLSKPDLDKLKDFIDDSRDFQQCSNKIRNQKVICDFMNAYFAVKDQDNSGFGFPSKGSYFAIVKLDEYYIFEIRQ